ncbi:hypothetical protein [Nocardiopsis sp. NRRL B-16309]|uniref:hypothetical protein n=1 Tax=Nocardiopsis sp. NRRL B-16309 TaxID=1519494 RepID=UPI0006AE055B|nr:hypothetical protein [Nocardiopsis sp. NRRL B-16309]KOX22108.1 hypothetical protein ADL05_03580 [Nocardiopsis sp. NRRL B-16309]
MTELPPMRAARAGVFTSVCLAVSAGGHAAASGHGVPLIGLVAGAGLVFLSAWAGSARERGLGAITAWMLWGQLALHLLYSVASSSTGHGGHDPGSVAAGAEAMAAASGSGGMLGLHLAAAAVCAWWLRQGEAALFAYLRSVAAALLPLLLAIVPRVRPVPRPGRPPTPVRPRPSAPYLRHSLVLRGPPVAL